MVYICRQDLFLNHSSTELQKDRIGALDDSEARPQLQIQIIALRGSKLRSLFLRHIMYYFWTIWKLIRSAKNHWLIPNFPEGSTEGSDLGSTLFGSQGFLQNLEKAKSTWGLMKLSIIHGHDSITVFTQTGFSSDYQKYLFWSNLTRLEPTIFVNHLNFETG